MNLREDATLALATVLYADVSGSTRLYEQFGDATARADVADCLSILSEVVRRVGGRVVNSIGDEIQCTFLDPAKAAVASGEMHAALRDASHARRFRSGAMRVKVGWHHGAVDWRSDDVTGEAAVIARQLVALAKAEEVLTSGASVNTLPPALRRGARLIDRVRAQLGGSALDVYAMAWEDTDEITVVGTVTGAGEAGRDATLVLEYGGRRVCVDGHRSQFRLGRSDDNELAVQGRLASRHHAEIRCRHGRFHLRDNSTNGTVVVSTTTDTRRRTRVHREEIRLPREGWIGLGRAPDDHPQEAVHFFLESG